jgi:hypothetical protein
MPARTAGVAATVLSLARTGSAARRRGRDHKGAWALAGPRGRKKHHACRHRRRRQYGCDRRCPRRPSRERLRRCIDLRGDVTIEAATTRARRGTRARLALPSCPAEVLLRGWVFLDWGSRIAVEPVAPAERLVRIAHQRLGPIPPRDPGEAGRTRRASRLPAAAPAWTRLATRGCRPATGDRVQLTRGRARTHGARAAGRHRPRPVDLRPTLRRLRHRVRQQRFWERTGNVPAARAEHPASLIDNHRGFPKKRVGTGASVCGDDSRNRHRASGGTVRR